MNAGHVRDRGPGLDPPARAQAEVAELGRLVGGVRALHDAVETVGPLVRRVAPEPRRLDDAPPCGAGACWYSPAELYSPRVRRIWSSTARGSRSGWNASPGCRPATRSAARFLRRGRAGCWAGASGSACPRAACHSRPRNRRPSRTFRFSISRTPMRPPGLRRRTLRLTYSMRVILSIVKGQTCRWSKRSGPAEAGL